MSCKYKILENHIHNLNVDGFKKEYNKIMEIDEIDICIISKILNHYPEIKSIEQLTDEILIKRKENIESITKMIDHILLDTFCFDNSIIRKKHDEILKFENLYNVIGWSYVDPLDGNTLAHHQVSGLHVDGIEFIMNKERKLSYMGLDIKNKKENTPLEVLFLEDHVAFRKKVSNENKSLILDMLLNFNTSYDFNCKSNIFYRALFFQIFKAKKINMPDLILLINKFKIDKNYIELNMNKISNMLSSKNIKSRRVFSIIKNELLT